MKINLLKIKQLMRTHNMRVCQFADFIGCDRPSVSRMLRGERKASLNFVFSVALAFDINPQDFIVGKNKKRGGNGHEH